MKMFKDTAGIPFRFEILESSKPGIMRVRGVFQKADTKNANGRIYPRSLWEKILSDKSISERVKTRKMIGELEHPSSGMSSLDRTSHVITDLKLEGANVIGTAEVLDTPCGKIVQELIRKDVSVGISSRGEGTSRTEGDTEVVGDDYTLVTFDFVASPSTPGAYPELVNESSIRPVAVPSPTRGDQSMNERLKYLESVTAKCGDIAKLISAGGRADLERYQSELVESLLNVSKLVSEDTTLKLYSEGTVKSITEAQNLVKEALTKVNPSKPSFRESKTGNVEDRKARWIRHMREKAQARTSVRESYQARALLKKNQALSALVEGLTKKCRSLVESNRILQKKSTVAVSLLGELAEEADRNLIRRKVHEAVKAQPALRKVESDLLKVSSIKELESKIAMLKKVESKPASAPAKPALAVKVESRKPQVAIKRDPSLPYGFKGKSYGSSGRVPVLVESVPAGAASGVIEPPAFMARLIGSKPGLA